MIDVKTDKVYIMLGEAIGLAASDDWKFTTNIGILAFETAVSKLVVERKIEYGVGKNLRSLRSHND